MVGGVASWRPRGSILQVLPIANMMSMILKNFELLKDCSNSEVPQKLISCFQCLSSSQSERK